MNLYLTKHGRLRRKDNTLCFEEVKIPPEYEYNGEEEYDILDATPKILSHNLPVENIDAVYIFGEMSLNTKLINFLNSNKIPVHIFNWYGHHTGTIMPHAEQLSGDLVIAQGAAYTNMEKRLYICKALLNATMHNIKSVLQYYERRKGGLAENIIQLESYQNRIADQTSVESLMGLEGNARRLYYQSWQVWLGDAGKNFKRVYHPPDNPLNAIISFVNSLLYTACVSELYRTALYAGISYLHTPQTRRFSLALDLVEPFKPIMCDRLIFRLLSSRTITDKDFLKHSNGFILTPEGRKTILQSWDAMLRETTKKKELKRSVSYRQLLRLDCYKLINYLLEEREYKPFKIGY